MSDNYAVDRALESLRLRLAKHEQFAADVAALLLAFERCDGPGVGRYWRELLTRAEALKGDAVARHVLGADVQVKP